MEELVEAQLAEDRVSVFALGHHEHVRVQPPVLLVADHVFDPLPPQVRPRLLYHKQVAPSQEEAVAGYVEPLPPEIGKDILFFTSVHTTAYYTSLQCSLVHVAARGIPLIDTC